MDRTANDGSSNNLTPLVIELMSRRGHCDREALTRLASRSEDVTPSALLDDLVRNGVLDRVAARAVMLIAQGMLDERDLKQLLVVTRAQTRLGRLSRAHTPVDVTTPAPVRRLAIGSMLGKFTVKGLLGEGGSARVYLGLHADLRMPVAIKMYNASARAQFDVETAILPKINHPNVVRVLDVAAAGDDPYLVLEYLDGESVRQMLDRSGPLPVTQVVRIARHVLRGLRALYRRGYRHGDVKPGNILSSLGQQYKLADFGLARSLRSARSAAETTHARGSWAYMAPEAFDGVGDHRSDIYSLGLTLYHLLTGELPVAGSTAEQCQRLHQKLSLEPLHWTVLGVSRRLSDLILQMAARSPEDRPGDYGELLSEFGAEADPARPPCPPTSRDSEVPHA